MNNLVKKEKQTGIVLSDLGSVLTFSEVIVKSGRMSRDYNLETTAMIVMYAQEIGISPMKAILTGFDIIQGKISMKPAMMNEMIRKAGHTIIIEKWEADECILTGIRKDDGTKMTIRYTAKDAEKAGLLSKDNYKKNPKNMMFARNMGNLGRMLFADVIGNSYVEGELEEEKPVKKLQLPDDSQTFTVEAEEISYQEVEEEKPKPVFIPPEALHQAMDILGCKISIESLKEYIFYVAERSSKSQEFVVQQAMECDDNIQHFITCYKKWIESKQKTSM